MKQSIGVLAVILLATTARQPARAQGPVAGPIVVDGATLIDVVTGATVPDSVVVIEGKRIKAAGARGIVAVPSGATTIPARGKFIMPGLTDAHVHLRDWSLELFLAYGVTSVLDLGNNTEWMLALREGIEDGRIRGPRLFTSGGTVNGPPQSKGHHYTVDTPQKATEVTAYLAGRGVDVIKLHEKLQVPEAQAAIAEAHRHNLPVVGHLGIDARDAILAGIDSITHASGVGIAATTDPMKKAEQAKHPEFGLLSFTTMDPQGIADTVKLFRDHHVFLEPNLVTTAQGVVPHARHFPDEWLSLFGRPELAYVPADNPMRWQTLFMANVTDRQHLPEYEHGWENLKAFIKAYVAAGGTVIAGTDTQTFVPAGLPLQQELELYVTELGFTPLDALRSATINITGFLRRSDLGTIKAGNLADLIVLRDNPLKDIRNLRSIDTVIVNGRVQDHSFHADYRIPIARPDDETSGGNPRPVVTEMSPIVAVEGAAPVKIVVNGSAFVPETVLRFDGKPIPTTFRSRRQLEGEIPAALLHQVGTFRVTAFSPRPDGGESGAVYFIVKFRRDTH